MYERYRSRVRERTTIPLRPQETSLTGTPGIPQPRPQPNQKDSGEPILEIEGVYIISVAARILDMHPQTLRKYERLGLISPGRTVGMLRLYSQEDIRKIRLIRYLANDLGLNLAGVELTLGLVDNLFHLRKRLAAVTEGSPLQAQVVREIDQLFHYLNLPVEVE